MFKLRVPPRFKGASLADLDERKFKAVLAYAKNLSANLKEGRGLLLSGPVGVGKTHAAAALTRHFVRSVARGDHEFVTAPELMDNVSEFDQATDTYRDQSWMTTYSCVPWLVINDAGKEYRGGKLSEQVAYKLGRLLRSRCEKKLVTHITTNANGDALRDAYGESITSLLAEMTDAVLIGGNDRRMER